MNKQLIYLGGNPNDGNGDDLRKGGGFINDNFNQIFPAIIVKISTDPLTPTINDNHWVLDGTTAPIVVNLPLLSPTIDNKILIFSVKNIGNSCSVERAGSDIFSGGATSFIFSTLSDVIIIQANDTLKEWRIIDAPGINTNPFITNIGDTEEYTTIAEAFTASKYNLRLMSDVSMTQHETLIAKVKIDLNGFLLTAGPYRFTLSTFDLEIINGDITYAGATLPFLVDTTKYNSRLINVDWTNISTNQVGLSYSGAYYNCHITTSATQDSGFGKFGGAPFTPFSGIIRNCKITGGVGAYPITCDEEADIVGLELFGAQTAIIVHNAHNVYIDAAATGRGAYHNCYNVMQKAGSAHTVLGGSITGGVIRAVDFVTFGVVGSYFSNVQFFAGAVTISKAEFGFLNCTLSSSIAVNAADVALNNCKVGTTTETITVNVGGTKCILTNNRVKTGISIQPDTFTSGNQTF